ncbi:MAG: DNA mismatch repair protein MutS [Flavobacteriaceae bacterium]|nr:DNA mismatch repair protein MutS [Flavobacteriaceae bacterium]
MSKKIKKETPLMKQYNAVKAKYPDALLLFRVGDFYETFGNDAIKASEILDIVLTKRGAGSQSETELAGFPHHSLNTYLPKLVKAGERVAICDQLEDPKKTKKIVKRGVTELITPGVSMNDEVLSSRANNFLASVFFGDSVGVSFLDVSTGEFLIAQGEISYIGKLLQNFNPSEVLVEKLRREAFYKYFGDEFHVFFLEDWVFQTDYSTESLIQHFGTKSLKGFGIESLSDGLIASGSILHYLKETQHDKLKHIASIKRIEESDFVWMDKFTIRNLELYGSNNYGATTLLEIIDRTISPMGARLLKRWLAFPLKSVEAIKSRHLIVDWFFNNLNDLEEFQNKLKGIGDLERLISKVAIGKVNPREVVQLKNSLLQLISLKELMLDYNDTFLNELGKELEDCEEICSKIEDTLNENAPVSILKGNSIKSLVSEELSNLREIAFSGKDYLDKMLDREIQSTGISSLKIASNNVFGYYIEVRNTHKDKVPDHWIRKQTLVSAERYISQELKEYEEKILFAENQILELEKQYFFELVSKLGNYIGLVQKNAQIVAKIDCLSSFAYLARDQRYVKPKVTESLNLSIKQGRHPVIENQLPNGETYVPNDLFLDRETQQIIMITGPNMSGKSAILRQTALIVLLAQIGSFVPAKSAQIGVVDKLFTRVGASDNISIGESTFMVEMNETASILNNLSERSLILLDEIGRGTSTYDGISIAWAICEYLHEHSTKAKTLFATHYHELNEMCETFSRIKNYNVAVKELKNKVLFLRTLVPGGSQHSFGIHVAKMAGMPKPILDRSKELLLKLEKSHSSEELTARVKDLGSEMQLSFFNLDDPILEEVKQDILNIDIDQLSPVEALIKLNEIKRKLSNKK